MAKKKNMSNRQRKAIRTQQIILGVISILVILSWVISLVAK